jgi:hypothetical protein
MYYCMKSNARKINDETEFANTMVQFGDFDWWVTILEHVPAVNNSKFMCVANKIC